MPNCPTSEELTDYVTGRLKLAEHEAIEGHLDTCDACQDTLAVLDEQTDGERYAGLQSSAPPENRDQTLMRLVAQAKALRDDLDAPSAEINDSDPEIESGTQLGNYVVEEPVGGGNMGFVYRARHMRMKRDVALKFIAPKLLEAPAARRRFQREIEIIARANHPHVVTAFDADEIEQHYFLVMEFVDGSDMREVVRQDGPLPVEDALRAIRDAAEGLRHVHQLGLVHRDVKPSNLLLDASGAVKVADLGLVRLAEVDPSGNAEVTQTGLVAGTPAFMSPEQFHSPQKVDAVSDVYGLGCTLFYLLTGTTAFQLRSGHPRAAGEPTASSLSEFRSDCPRPVDELVAAMMSDSREQRPASMAEVIMRVDAILTELDQPTNEGATLGTFDRRSSLIAAASAIVVAISLLALVWGLFIGTNPDKQVAEEAAGESGDASGVTTRGAEVDPSPPPATPEIELVRIEPATFQMGSPNDSQHASADEKPRHEVTISRPFLIGKFEVTVDQFNEVMGSAAEKLGAPPDAAVANESIGRLPVSGISWFDAVAFCNSLSERHGLQPYYEVEDKSVSIVAGSDGFRLPTEAEWELACRAGGSTQWSCGDDEAELAEYAWFAANSMGNLQPVGTRQPNGFGIHDMHGNAPEWCWDRHDLEYYTNSEAIDPPGSARGMARVFRGGGVSNRPAQLRSAARNSLGGSYGFLNFVGLRVAKSLPAESP